MAEPWIRVHANLPSKPIVWRAVQALGVKQHEAMGLLMQFWGEVSQHAQNGAVSHFPDDQLESWAGWRGKRGRFATFIRTTHLDNDGRVNEWDDYAGALEIRREKERERLRNKRLAVGQLLRNTERTVAQQTQVVATRARERDETIRNETNYNSTSSSGTEPDSEVMEASLSLQRQVPNNDARTAIVRIMDRSNSPLACITALTSIFTGNDPSVKQPTPEQFAVAVLDYFANGHGWNVKHFRGYVKSAVAPEDALLPRRAKYGEENGGSAALVLRKIKELAHESQAPGQAALRFVPRQKVADMGTDVLAAYDAIGGADRILNTAGADMSFLIRDFSAALSAAKGST